MPLVAVLASGFSLHRLYGRVRPLGKLKSRAGRKICGIRIRVRAISMALGIQARVSGEVLIVRCDGGIVFGDEGAALRERVRQMLSGSPRIVVNLNGVHYVDSGGLGILVGLSVSARNRGGELKLASPSQRVSDLLRRTRLEGIISVYRN